MKKQNEGRRTVKVELRLIPWQAFALKAYAKWHGGTISCTVMEGMNCLLSYVPKPIIDRWLDEYQEKSEKHEKISKMASPGC